MSSQGECQLTAGGMPHHGQAGENESVPLRHLRHETKRLIDVLESLRPAAAGISYPPIFHVPRRHALCGESSAQVTGMREVILRAPESAMQEHKRRMRSFARRAPQIDKLIRVRSVVQALIRGRRRKRQDVFAAHERTPELAKLISC